MRLLAEQVDCHTRCRFRPVILASQTSTGLTVVDCSSLRAVVHRLRKCLSVASKKQVASETKVHFINLFRMESADIEAVHQGRRQRLEDTN